jgi:hypothetical protein
VSIIAKGIEAILVHKTLRFVQCKGGSAMGLSATDAWRRAAVGDGVEYAPNLMK